MKNWENNNIETLDGEIWKVYPSTPVEYNGTIWASNYGRVKRGNIIFKNSVSKKRKYSTSRGRKVEYICKQHASSEGYLIVNLFGLSCKVHRMVCCSFYGDKSHLIVNHINCDKKDNRPENLEWCTKKQNSEHAWKNGLINFSLRHVNKGESHCFAKLNNTRVRVIRRLDKNIFTNSYISSLYGVSRRVICDVRNGVTWKSIL
jgi:hypothetical protein